MASLQQDFAPGAVSLPFAQHRHPDEPTFLPRARYDFDVDAEAITAKATANTNRLRVTCSLPQNYAYVLDNVFAQITITGGLPGDADGIDNIEQVAVAALDPRGPQAKRQMEFRGSAAYITGAAEADGGRLFTLQSISRQPFFNVANAIPNIIVTFTDGDNSNATLAGVLTFHCSFLQYDLEQAYLVNVNAPMPVRTS